MENNLITNSSITLKVTDSNFFLIFLLSLLLLTLPSCGGKKKDAEKKTPLIPVDIAEVIVQDTPLFVQAIGNVAAFNTVDVKSRVTGQLIKKFFMAGEFLKVGQELFTIDPAPFEAKVKEAEAKLSQSKVQFEQAKRDYLRFKTLYSEKAVSAEQLETKEVDMNSKHYQVDLINAELALARLDLGYCFIKSPLDGPSGEIYIDNFNIVTANQDRLVTIKQVQPIKVKFSVPGKLLDEINKYNSVSPLRVDAFVRRTDKPEQGELTLIDNQINLRTGMIGLEATFVNPDSRLWPGEFVDVRLYLTVTMGAAVVPERSVNDGPDGKYVWIVDDDNKVSMRPVIVDRRYENLAVISDGVKSGERIVTDGQLLLRPGAQVVSHDKLSKTEAKRSSPQSADHADNKNSDARLLKP